MKSHRLFGLCPAKQMAGFPDNNYYVVLRPRLSSQSNKLCAWMFRRAATCRSAAVGFTLPELSSLLALVPGRSTIPCAWTGRRCARRWPLDDAKGPRLQFASTYGVNT